ncbi:MAG TPA: hypothetical protein DCR43_03360 [Bacteroidales bacterium]|nr:MAG: hypothetical protein A2X11_00115 [Bacteroidetes bacterium GWE2_42_24]OFY27793.1 MAG: hypothetical protein A2X09_02785 [Bacteroidetes bacterium GWF2_43_11]PKP20138.1 MAG: hypothetical protein CVU06_10825 [Bacteroidetes bacterium HGW-Bacteroidetes-22]HAQ64881.1 hypothetical protein [Bacteroidales bacterium]HBZ66153.1 hypothetical protein [Bacteroidales bacterium]
MTDWLEEAEGKPSRQSSPEKIASHIEQRQKLVKANYASNANYYDAFISELSRLIARVNNLPAHTREPFGKLEGRPKRSKFDNKLFIFSSSYRFKKRKSGGIFRWFGFRHYKHIRVFYLSVSKQEGFADAEIKDYILEKHRLGTKGDDKTTLHDHHLLLVPMVDLKPENARMIIDWLAFKAETSALPFDFSLNQL